MRSHTKQEEVLGPTRRSLCKRRVALHGDCTAFFQMSLHLQESANAVKTKCMHCERSESAVKVL